MEWFFMDNDCSMPILKTWWLPVQRSMPISVQGVFTCGMALHGLC